MTESVTLTDKGLVRAENQDSFLADDLAMGYVVADGMGGGAEGALASAMLVREIGAALKVDPMLPMNKLVDVVSDAVGRANAEIYAHCREHNYRQMGTTLASVFFENGENGRAVVCHVGDSRVYRIRGEFVEPLTSDHTVVTEFPERVAETCRRLNTTPEVLEHMLTRAVGAERTVRAAWKRIRVMPGDIYFLCSDGVHGFVSDREIGEAFVDRPLDAACRRLQESIVRAGAADNYTMVAVRVTP